VRERDIETKGISIDALDFFSRFCAERREASFRLVNPQLCSEHVFVMPLGERSRELKERGRGRKRRRRKETNHRRHAEAFGLFPRLRSFLLRLQRPRPCFLPCLSSRR